MGMSIQKQQPSLEDLLAAPLNYAVDRSKHRQPVVSAWRISPQGLTTQPLTWPYQLSAAQCYILMVVAPTEWAQPIINKDRTSIELAEILFRAQFLLPHLSNQCEVTLSNRTYSIELSSFFGDSIEDEPRGRAALTSFMYKIQKYLQLGAGMLCINSLNSSQPLTLNKELTQYIDLNSQQYLESRNHPLFNNILFRTSHSHKESINNLLDVWTNRNFSQGSQQVPFINVQPRQGEDKILGSKDLEQSLPFACEITQINIKGTKKAPRLEAGHIGQSNMLDELGIVTSAQEIESSEQFLKGLYIGTEKCSKNFSFLTSKQIKLVVNCAAASCRNWFINDLSYKWIDMPDPATHTGEYNIECLVYQVADLVGKCLAEPAGVLIHCSTGDAGSQYSGSRSAVILLSVLMSVLKLSFDDAYNMVSRSWRVQVPAFMERQLRDLEARRSKKPKGYQVYTICSYSVNYPSHLVAKYICDLEDLSKIQGIEGYETSMFLCAGSAGTKLLVGKECSNREQYQNYAREHLRLLSKYEGVSASLSLQPIDKTFRKQPPLQVREEVLHLGMRNSSRIAGYQKNEEIVLKYPILRPVWEKKKDDAFYFTVREHKGGAEVIMKKGQNWIGYEFDKNEFFDRIISCYLGHVPHDKIYIVESEENQNQTIFDTSQIHL